jgi:glycosyltransferase involved in cell wall biosynthesis
MRILFMADAPRNPDSGAAGTEYQTVNALRELGHEVTAVWGDDLPRRIGHGNLHYVLELPWVYRARMRRELNDRSYDVIHVNQPHGYLAARDAQRHPKRPVFVHRSHGFESRVTEALRPWRNLEGARPLHRRALSATLLPFLDWSNRAIARYADGHVVSAQLCADFLKRRFGIEDRRVAVVPQAPPALYQQTVCPPMDQNRLDRILYVGQFAFVKAPQILAAAIDKILAMRPQSKMTWVCAAQHHEAAAALLPLRSRSRVTFLDWMPQADLMSVYDSHGVFLFPSFFEGFGKAFIEAMSRGLVVVASSEGGARDLIEDGRNGRVVPVGDADALANACIGAQSSLLGACAMAERARMTGLRLTWLGLAEQTTAFYERLLSLR